MTITNLDGLLYGVDDMEKSTQFYEDWGLKKVESGKNGAIFNALDGSTIELRNSGDASLPDAPISTSTVREVIWGVDDQAGVDAIADELSRDRQITRDDDGMIHAHDPAGFGIGFRKSTVNEDHADLPSFNTVDTINRRNVRAIPDDRVTPRRIGHVVYSVADLGDEETRFYCDRLGFRLTDTITETGTFMRAEGSTYHHNLFFVKAGPNICFNHVAFEVLSIDQVLMGGMYLEERDWESAIGPGRHIVGGNVFWYFKNPCGGDSEYFADMDRADDSWEAGVWDSQENTWSSWSARKGERTGRQRPKQPA